MKYEKFSKDGVAYIRITISECEVVERPMVEADKAYFQESVPVPAEPYPEGP